jgi:hypothetical protein
MVSMRRLISLVLPALLLIGAPRGAGSQDADPPAATSQVSAHAADLKALQVRMLMRRMERELAEKRGKAREKRERARHATRRGAARRDARGGEGLKPELREREPAAAARTGAARIAPPAGVSAIAANVIANNRATDDDICGFPPCTGLPWSGQAEVSIGAHGNNLVAAWNDGAGFNDFLSTQGFAYSTNNGATWTDGGIPPVSGGIGEWTSDPVIAVNEKTGAFYYAALCSPSGSTNGIGVVKGTFSGGSFAWGTPRVAISGSNTAAIYDKEWLAADSLTGNLYLVYAKFTISGGQLTGNEIQYLKNVNDNTGSWTGAGGGAASKLSSATDDGRVQGPRVAIGPAGEVWTAWNAIGPTSADFMRVKRAPAGGSTFGAEVTAVSQYTNFGSGAPGFNRGTGFAFPGLAVDRSTGPHRGRAYLTWNESVNFYNDNFPNPVFVFVGESEANDTPATADVFTIGQNLIGDMNTTNDLDYWRFDGTQGQTIICELDSVYTTTLDAGFRLFCSDGATRLAFSESGFGGFNLSSALIVFTLPASGTYYLRVSSISDGFTPPGTGRYRIRTVLNGAVTERGRDHRDVFVSTSLNGTTWTTPARVNGEPAIYDDWLPEVAVGGNSHAYVQWYDWRDAPAGTCGGASMLYLSRSTDGGVTWPDGSPVTGALTSWTTTYSNIIPNQGDYTGLFANAAGVYACWTDGRNGDPDVFTAVVNPVFTATQVSLAATHAEPGLVRITWQTSGAATLRATAYRRPERSDWTALGDLLPDAAGRITLEDRDVTAGARYVYRLGVHEPEGEVFTSEVAVRVPLAAEFAIHDVHPNPTEGEVWVSYALPAAGEAALDLVDVAGRRVATMTLQGPGGSRVLLTRGGDLPAGIYVVRLTQQGRSVTRRVSIVR